MTRSTLDSRFNVHGGPPAADDDGAARFFVGYRWLDQVNNEEYVCVDATDGAAVWLNTTTSDAAGDVVGPAGAVDDNLVTFDGVTGKLVQDSGSAVSDFATAAQGATADLAMPLAGGAFSGDVTTSGTFDGRDVDADGTKLDGVEDSATADQTGAEIKAAYEVEANAFTDAQFTKLGGIEALATIDQTGAEIKAAYEGEADTNVFDDADVTKLGGIQALATDDQTGAEIKAAYEGEADTNVFDDADVTKLGTIEDSATADQTGAEIKTAYEAEVNAFTDAQFTKLGGIEALATIDQTGAEIKTAYEGEADTNAFDDAAVTKLGGIEALADVTDATNVAAAGAMFDLTDDASPQLAADLDVDGNGLVSTSDADIPITPNGSGKTRVTNLEAPLPSNTQTGTSYEAVLDDADKMITLDNASPVAMTIPANSSVAFPVGTKLNFMQLGAGAVTVDITTDTLDVVSSLTLVLNGQFSVAIAYKVTATSWVLTGELAVV